MLDRVGCRLFSSQWLKSGLRSYLRLLLPAARRIALESLKLSLDLSAARPPVRACHICSLDPRRTHEICVLPALSAEFKWPRTRWT